MPKLASDETNDPPGSTDIGVPPASTFSGHPDLLQVRIYRSVLWSEENVYTSGMKLG